MYNSLVRVNVAARASVTAAAQIKQHTACDSLFVRAPFIQISN